MEYLKSAWMTILSGAMTACIGQLAISAQLTTVSQSVASTEQSHRFPQKKISTCDGLPKVLHVGRSDLRYVDGDLTITGVDEAGHTYTATKGTSVLGCEIWSADLDGNGVADLVVLTKGLDSSAGYDSELSLILYGRNGEPLPWKAVGKFHSDSRGIAQIVGDGSTKCASVIVPTKEGSTGPDAHEAFQLYSFVPSSVRKVTGVAFGVAWPVFQNSTPELARHQANGSLSFNFNVVSGSARLTGSNTASVTATSMLSLADGQQVEPPAVVVQQTADGNRSILFDPVPSDIAALLKQHMQVATMGRSCEEEECRPFIMVAKP